MCVCVGRGGSARSHNTLIYTLMECDGTSLPGWIGLLRNFLIINLRKDAAVSLEGVHVGVGVLVGVCMGVRVCVCFGLR